MGNSVRFKASLDDKVSGKLGKIRDDFDRLGKSKGAATVLQGVGVGAAGPGQSLVAGMTCFAWDGLDHRSCATAWPCVAVTTAALASSSPCPCPCSGEDEAGEPTTTETLLSPNSAVPAAMASAFWR